MASTQLEKANRFRALHQAPGSFLIANAWDAGSARILAGLGFQALATSSGASAGVLGRRDGMVTRQEALDHSQAIVAATDVPVSADLERGFDDAPEGAAETIRLAAGVGLVGGSIEDFSGNPQKPLYDLSHAKERVAAAAEAARKLPVPFTLTARAENFLRGNPDLDDTSAPTASKAFSRSDGARLARSRCGEGCLRGVVASVQLHGRHQGTVVSGRGTRGRRRQADKSRDVALPGGDERPRQCRARGKRTGHLRLCRHDDGHTRTQRLHGRYRPLTSRAPAKRRR